jgi:hypothetical protein
MRDRSRSCSRKARLSLSAILVTCVLFGVSTSVWPQTSENFDGYISAPAVVNGDYDGDFVTHFAVWRPSEGIWYIISSVDENTTRSQQWGVEGDIPVPGDYDGDLINDVAVWRPREGN